MLVVPLGDEGVSQGGFVASIAVAQVERDQGCGGIIDETE